MAQNSIILIVDDEPGGRDTLEALLIGHGYALAFAENGETALAKAFELIPDLILLDVMMPGMDGYEVCKRLRADPILAEVPIIIITALDDRDSKLLGFEAGADDFISKPFDRAELRARVRAVTRLNRYRRLLLERIRFEKVVELSPYGIMIVDSEATVRSANPAMFRMLGVESENSIVGNKAALLVSRERSEEFLSYLNHVLIDPTKLSQLEIELIRSNGERFPAEVDFGGFIWDDKPATQLFVRDISERKSAEERIRTREQQQATVAEIGQLALEGTELSALVSEVAMRVAQTLDLEFCKVLEMVSNDGMLLLRESKGLREEYVGYAASVSDESSMAKYALILFSNEPVIIEDIRTETRFKAPKLLLDHGLVSGISVVIKGSVRPLGILGAYSRRKRTFTKDDTNFLQAVANVLASAIERKLDEDKMREQAALLDITRDAIIVCDLENSIQFWNKSAERIYKFSSAEALGRIFFELVCNQDPFTINEAVRIATEKGEWSGEFRQVAKGGKEFTVDSRWTLMYDQNGKPKSILIVNTDITEKKRLEEKFLRAQRMENIGILAGGIAHDLNNLLTPIILTLQILKKKVSGESILHMLTIAETTAQRGVELIKQVLSFGHGIEGKRVVLQLRHIILEIEKIAKETFPKSMEIVADVQKDLWTVSADVTQLHQVLMNLCVNARDAMPHGGRLTISVKNFFIDENYAKMSVDAKIGPYVVITVSDMGTGIPAEILDKIFDPFFTTKEIGKGTGLGLSTVMGIVKNHDGFLSVYSEVGKGTEFKVYLQAIETDETQQAESNRHELPVGTGKLILVVDDEASIREITKATLETYDYKVLTANDGTEAISIYVENSGEIGAVITDMMMPFMDGLSTIRALQRINSQVKIIAVSGLMTKDKAADALSSGAKALLSKPYTAEELLFTLYKVLAD